MCGTTSAKVGTADTVKAAGEGTGVDQSAASGVFVLSIEHLHGGGGVLFLVAVLVVVCAVVWWCTRRRMLAGRGVGQHHPALQQQGQAGVVVSGAALASTEGSSAAPVWTPG